MRLNTIFSYIAILMSITLDYCMIRNQLCHNLGKFCSIVCSGCIQLPYKDHHKSLCSFSIHVNSEIIDVSAIEPHSMERSEFMEKMRLYQ